MGRRKNQEVDEEEVYGKKAAKATASMPPPQPAAPQVELEPSVDVEEDEAEEEPAQQEVPAKGVKTSVPAEEVRVHKALFGKLLVDKKGASLLSVKYRECCGFLAASVSVAIVDPRTGCRQRNQYCGVDDVTYDKYPELRKLVPRCFCAVFKAGSTANQPVSVMRGMAKFTGLETAEEDEAGDSPNKRSKEHMCDAARIKQATHLLVTLKANGKSFAMTRFSVDGKGYYILGSKNSHVVVNASPSLDTASQVPGGLDLVQEMAMALDRLLSKMNANARAEFDKILDDNTLCAEYEDGMHLIPLPDGEEPSLRCFALVPKAAESSLGLDRWQCLNRLSVIGVTTVPFKLVPITQLDAELTLLRKTPHVEGAVLDFLKKRGEKEEQGYELLETVKFKSVWYVLTRSVREIVKGALSAKAPGSDEEKEALTIRRIAKTLQARSRDFLHLSDNTLAQYVELYGKFISWYVSKGLTGQDMHSQGMAHWWTRFLKETKVNDVIESEITGPLFPAAAQPASSSSSETELPAVASSSSSSAPTEGPAAPTEAEGVPGPVRVVVFTHGIPGDGKTTRARQLTLALGEMGFTARVIEQDDFGGDGESTLQGFAQACADHVGTQIVIVSRCNANKKQYFKYLEISKRQGMISVGLAAEELETPEMTLVAIHSLLSRDAGSHGTMNKTDAASKAEYVQVALSFRAVLELPREGRDVDHVIRFKALQPFSAPKTATKYLSHYLKTVSESPFKARPRPIGDVVSGLAMDQENYSQHRLPLTDVCTAIAHNLVSLITELKPLRPSPVFIGLPVPDAASALLKRLCIETISKTKRPPLSAGGLWYLSHITLGHMFNANDYPGLWKKLINSVCVGDRVTVRCESIVASKKVSGSMVIRVSLTTEPGPTDATALVMSGRPHITAHLPPKVKPVEASKISAEAAASDVFPIPPEHAAALTWTSVITAYT